VGPVRVERSLYRRPHGEHALCPLELRAGIIEGSWTPLAAKQATWVVAHLTPKVEKHARSVAESAECPLGGATAAL
jgi:hypothetical protein